MGVDGVINYRSGVRPISPIFEGINVKFVPVKPDPIVVNPIYRSIVVYVKSSNLPKDYEMAGKITIVSSAIAHKYQFAVQFREEIYSYKVLTNVVIDVAKILVPEINNVPGEIVAKVVFGYGQRTNADYVATVKILTGDNNANVLVPVEPYIINVLRNYLKIDGVEINDAIAGGVTSEETSWKSWLFGGATYPSEVTIDSSVYNPFTTNYERAVIPITETFPDAYKFAIEVDYTGIPTGVMGIIQLYCRYVFVDPYYSVIIPNDVSSPHITIVVRIIPSLEKIHILAKTPGKDVIIFRPFTFPLTVKRALTLYTPYLVPGTPASIYIDPALPIAAYKGKFDMFTILSMCHWSFHNLYCCCFY